MTFAPEEALRFVDSVVIGEGESVWEQIFQDVERDTLQPRYTGKAMPLTDIPTPVTTCSPHNSSYDELSKLQADARSSARFALFPL